MGRRLVALGAVLVLLIMGVRHSTNVPVDPHSPRTVSVQVTEGMGGRAIARALANAGVLRSPSGFLVRVVLRGVREKLKAGTYEFSPRESGAVILERLVRGDTLPSDASVTFPEGFTLQQMASRLAAQGLVDESTVLAAATVGKFRQEFLFLKDAPADASLEGYLFPDTYRFRRGTVPDDILRRMLRRFAEQYEVALKETSGAQFAIRHSQFSIHQIVTMASIVEREVKSSEDRRLVAGILWKRLAAGVGLEADATIRYVVGDWEHPLTVGQLRVDSPYNTRRYRGLPPGPIGNPGLDSLKAAMVPKDSDSFYYLSAPSGETIFSTTLDEHNAAKATYLH